MERATGIEPAWPAWEAEVLPLNYARNSKDYYSRESAIKKAQRLDLSAYSGADDENRTRVNSLEG